MGSYWQPWAAMGSHGQPWAALDSQCTGMGSHGQPGVPVDSHGDGQPVVARGSLVVCPGQPWAALGRQELPGKVTLDSHGLLWAGRSSPVMSWAAMCRLGQLWYFLIVLGCQGAALDGLVKFIYG